MVFLGIRQPEKIIKLEMIIDYFYQDIQTQLHSVCWCWGRFRRSVSATQHHPVIIKTEPGRQPIRARYLGHVAGFRPIRDQYFLILSSSKQHQKENEDEWSDGCSDGDEEDFIEFRLNKKGPNSASNNK